MSPRVAASGPECLDCGFCTFFVPCFGQPCYGCDGCVTGCPSGARQLIESAAKKTVEVTIDGTTTTLPANIPITEALKLHGYEISRHPHEPGQVSAPCSTGGCWECAVLANGEIKPACVTPIKAGMTVVTDKTELMKHEPVRLVASFAAYPDPKLHPQAPPEYSCWTQGCNLRCPTCHNWEMTFAGNGRVRKPAEVAQALLKGAEGRQARKITISGGESTLNRRWLVSVLRYLRYMDQNPDLRVQVDTAAGVLTPDYIDELVASGMTDFSPDLKASNVETFMAITGLTDPDLARLNMDTAWAAVEYVTNKHKGRVFMMVALPYHADLMPLEELAESARRLAAIDPTIPVSVIEYQCAFRRPDLRLMEEDEIQKAMETLEAAGLTRIWLQAADEMPPSTDPRELLLGSDTIGM